jgi:hypothetical protein
MPPHANDREHVILFNRDDVGSRFPFERPCIADLEIVSRAQHAERSIRVLVCLDCSLQIREDVFGDEPCLAQIP